MNKNELWKLYTVQEKKVEKAREKRIITTIAIFAIVFFALLCVIEKPSGIYIVGGIFGSVILAGIYVVVNAAIFGNLYKASEDERKMLENIKKKIDEAE